MGKIIALDVSLRGTGYAVLDASAPAGATVLRHGCIPTASGGPKVGKGEDTVRRCGEIAAALQEVIEGWPPRLIIAELPTGSQDYYGAKAAGICYGIIGSIRIILDVPLLTVTPQAVKKAAAGRLNASKDDVQRGVLDRFQGLQFRTKVEREAVCDALGAYLAAAGSKGAARDLFLMALAGGSDA